MHVIVELCIYAIHVDWLQIQCSLLWHGCRTNLLQWTRDKRPFLSKTCNTSTWWQYIHKLRMFLFLLFFCLFDGSRMLLFMLSFAALSSIYLLHFIQFSVSWCKHMCSLIFRFLCCVTERNFNCSFSNAKRSINECKCKANGDMSSYQIWYYFINIHTSKWVKYFPITNSWIHTIQNVYHFENWADR